MEIYGTPLYDPALQSRAITMENRDGAKGAGGKANDGRKGAPCLWNLEKDQVFTFAEIDGPGCIRHIWITVPHRTPKFLRNLILRFYWDGQKTPSVEVPLGDFFGVPHGRTAPHESAFLVTPEGKGFNCYFPMPFAHHARLDIANESGEDSGMFFFQVDYTLGDAVTKDTPYFHAQFRRDLNTTLKEDFVILDGVRGKGRFMGANVGIVDRFLGYGEIPMWWGEGEVKMYIDGDTDYPTICGTGSEDYAGTGWGMGQYDHLQLGAPLREGPYISYYRYHGSDPVYFSEDIRVTVQQIGNDGMHEPADPEGPLKEFIERGEYLKEGTGGNFERVDDMCATAYWYQTLPTQPFPPLPPREVREHGLTPDEDKAGE